MKRTILSLFGMVLLLVSCKPKNTTDDPSTPLPKLSVKDVVVDEGRVAIFTVSLSKPATEEITFEYTFQPGTASLSDYETSSSNPTITGKIAIGEIDASISTFTNRDDVQEGDETFQLVLQNLKHATSTKSKGTCTIKNVQDQSAEYFMQAKIDGKPWDASYSDTFKPTLFIASKSEDNTSSMSGIGPLLFSQLHFSFNSDLQVGKYEIGTTSNDKANAWYINGLIYVSQPGGEVVFTKIDLVNKKAEGTFSFTAKEKDGKITQITEGKFRVYIKQ